MNYRLNHHLRVMGGITAQEQSFRSQPSLVTKFGCASRTARLINLEESKVHYKFIPGWLKP